MNNPLQPLRTEILFSEGRKQSELNKSVDRLAKEDRQQVAAPTDRGPWDSEHRRQHDALARKKKDQLTTAAGIIAVAILILINAELAARCFDDFGEADTPVCPSRTEIADRSVCATLSTTTNPIGE